MSTSSSSQNTAIRCLPGYGYGYGYGYVFKAWAQRRP